MSIYPLLIEKLFNLLWKASSAFFFFGILTSACSVTGSIAKSASDEEYIVPRGDGNPRNLAINGFNYTDLPIESFSVGASGGGNVFVSSPTSGGGGTTCCVVLYPGTLLPKPISIEWMRSVNGKDRWCKKTVQLNGPIPENSTALGVHFMPDGEIKITVTAGLIHPILKLERFDAGHRNKDRNIIYDEQKGTCKNGR